MPVKAIITPAEMLDKVLNGIHPYGFLTPDRLAKLAIKLAHDNLVFGRAYFDPYKGRIDPKDTIVIRKPERFVKI